MNTMYVGKAMLAVLRFLESNAQKIRDLSKNLQVQNNEAPGPLKGSKKSSATGTINFHAYSPCLNSYENFSLSQGRLRLPKGLNTFETAKSVQYNGSHVLGLRT